MATGGEVVNLIYFMLCYTQPCKVREQLYGKFENSNAIIIAGVLNHPLSIGTVRLRSKIPSDTLLIDPHYLEHPDDAKTMVESKILVCLQVYI